MGIFKEKEKYRDLITDIYHAFNPKTISLPMKLVLAVMAILTSLLITYIKILIR